jgi:hypothetical protein
MGGPIRGHLSFRDGAIARRRRENALMAPDPESKVQSPCLHLDSGFAPVGAPRNDNYRPARASSSRSLKRWILPVAVRGS